MAERLLLTGHSHQAWPDCAYTGQMQAWEDAACHVDDKWDNAFVQAQAVKAGFANLLDDDPSNVCLGTNTHELVIKFLSALPLKARPKLITTDGEFHTIRRQLDRLEEERITIEKIPVCPSGDLTERMISAIDDSTAAVLVSKVFFNTGTIATGMADIARKCLKHGAELLVDAYHAINVVPFTIPDEGLESAFVVGGGYKYCQLGEGNCFLRVPSECVLRPVITGWFAEFEDLAHARGNESVRYPDNAARFAGSTYDPVSHYRAAAVFDFFRKQQLNPALLREVNQHQVQLLINNFESLDPDPDLIDYDRSIPLLERGGFLVLQTPYAQFLQPLLKQMGVHTDYRGTALRFGPAPYLSDTQVTDAMQFLGEALEQI